VQHGRKVVGLSGRRNRMNNMIDVSTVIGYETNEDGTFNLMLKVGPFSDLKLSLPKNKIEPVVPLSEAMKLVDAIKRVVNDDDFINPHHEKWDEIYEILSHFQSIVGENDE
jgi:hypothetical protein